MKSTIPASLAPFFQEYDLASLRIEQDANTIIERTLRYGTRSELRWLFSVYRGEQIKYWLQIWGNFGLPEPHFTFWKLLLETETSE
jgi:hypothetical protein